MFKMLFLLSVLFCGQAFAQNMEPSEKFEDANIDMPDGSSRYVGKCSTHEDYEKFYFSVTKTLQKYSEPADMTKAEIKKMLAKFDEAAIKKVLTTMDMYTLGEKGESDVSIFTNYIDDMTVQTLTHIVRPELKLIRFSVGVGGGNGGYVVLNQVEKGSKITYELMSYTFDSDLNFCDRKVWLQNETK